VGGKMSSPSIHLPADGSDTVAHLKESIEKVHGIPFSSQCFKFRGKVLKDDEFLKDFYFEDAPELELHHGHIIAKCSSDVYKSVVDPEKMVDGFFADNLSCSSASSNKPSKYDESAECTSSRQFSSCSSHGGCSSGPCIGRRTETNLPIPSWFSSMISSMLPTRKLERGALEIQGACAVCQYDYDIEDEVVETPCNHIFHRNCLEPWLRLNTTCPHCRFELSGLIQNPSLSKTPNSCTSKKEERSSLFFPVAVDGYDTGLSIKEKIADVFSVPVETQRLICNGRKVDDYRALKNQKIEKDVDLQLVLRLDSAYTEKIPDLTKCQPCSPNMESFKSSIRRIGRGPKRSCVDMKCVSNASKRSSLHGAKLSNFPLIKRQRNEDSKECKI